MSISRDIQIPIYSHIWRRLTHSRAPHSFTHACPLTRHLEPDKCHCTYKYQNSHRIKGVLGWGYLTGAFLDNPYNKLTFMVVNCILNSRWLSDIFPLEERSWWLVLYCSASQYIRENIYRTFCSQKIRMSYKQIQLFYRNVTSGDEDLWITVALFWVYNHWFSITRKETIKAKLRLREPVKKHMNYERVVLGEPAFR